MAPIVPRATAGAVFCATAVCIALLISGGCAHYATPGRGADMRVLSAAAQDQTDVSVGHALEKHPMASLPTAIAVVRVQASGYRSETTTGWGRGAYSVVTTRDIENMDDAIGKISKQPMISGIAPVNRLLLPQQLNSDLELRQAAAAMHCDMLLIYTLDTTFTVEDAALPLSVITLGLSPNQVAHVACTASAVLMDTRNGYVYGVAEATERQKQLASAWTSEAAVDQTRRRTEAKAFEKLTSEVQGTWSGVVRQITRPAAGQAEPQ